jgi:lipoprotein-anchoring transpeptidase ErfK/SrfK
LGVTTAAVPNGRLAWIPGDRVHVRHVRNAIQIDLSSRQLRVLRADRVLRTIPVAIGRPGSPTPTGRFHVTDKLRGAAYGRAYGCCILALSGRQPQLPRGWAGGDRLAIHGTPRPDLIGARVSAGCLHARRSDLRYLMRTVRLGTPVFIRS